MKIIITHDSVALKHAGFDLDEAYEVSQAIGETLIGSKWAEEVKDLGPSPENKALSVPENK